MIVIMTLRILSPMREITCLDIHCQGHGTGIIRLNPLVSLPIFIYSSCFFHGNSNSCYYIADTKLTIFFYTAPANMPVRSISCCVSLCVCVCVVVCHSSYHNKIKSIQQNANI